jgi:hypothetical protein
MVNEQTFYEKRPPGRGDEDFADQDATDGERFNQIKFRLTPLKSDRYNTPF